MTSSGAAYARRPNLALNAKDFGALGLVDGQGNAVDYTAELQDAIKAAREARRPLYIPEGRYGVDDQLVRPNVDGNPVDPLGLRGYHIYGAGADLTVIETAVDGRAVFGGSGEDNSGSNANPLLARADAGQTFLELDTTAEGGVEPGDVLHLKDVGQQFLGGSDNTLKAVAGEVVRVLDVNSSTDTVTLGGGLDFSYEINDPPNRSTWRKPDWVSGVGLADMTVKSSGVTAAGSRCIALRCARDVDIRRVRFVGFADDPIQLERTIDWRITDCDFEDHPDEANPYCIAVAEYCQSGLVQGCRMRNGRHFFTTVGPPVGDEPGAAYIQVEDCEVFDCYYAGLDTHWGARHITFKSPVVHNTRTDTDNPSAHGIQIRGRDCVVLDPLVTGAQVGVNIAFGATGTYVRGGRVTRCDRGLRVVQSDDVRVDGLVIENAKRFAVEVLGDPSYEQMTGLKLRRVEVVGAPEEASEPTVLLGTYHESFEIDVYAPDAVLLLGGSAAASAAVSAKTRLRIPPQTYRVVADRGGILSAASSDNYILTPASIVGLTANTAGLAAFYLDPSDITDDPGGLRLALRATILTNNVAPATAFEFTLRRIIGAAGGPSQVSPQLASPVPGISLTATSASLPAAAARQFGSSSAPAPTAPPAAAYALVVDVGDPNMAASSAVAIRVQLIAR